MITVIIPALNEAETIEQVILLVKKCADVSEIIVVDDKSLDSTVSVAIKSGATVITSTKLGKGVSMKEGMLVAKNEIICYLDADITTYPDDVVSLLCNPILENKADFSKAYFTRQAGRVTELVAKPLLAILYPNFPDFVQPLSGMIAGKKSFFEQVDFEEGYGVDIGILIDMYQLNAKILEINIGSIENRMQSLEELGKMSKQVSSTIIKKSKQFNLHNLELFENIQIIREQMDFALNENFQDIEKLVIFDMDNTILRGSFIKTCAQTFDFEKELTEIVIENDNPIIRTKLIAQLLKGRTIAELLSVVDSIEITQNFDLLISHLKEKKYKIGIVSDSYDCITNHLKNKYNIDFTFANELEFSNSISTGEVKIPSLFLTNSGSICKHDYCKMNVLLNFTKKQNFDIKNIIYIGDGENDICSVKNVGIGISFCSSNHLLDTVADFVVKDADFKLLIPLIK